MYLSSRFVGLKYDYWEQGHVRTITKIQLQISMQPFKVCYLKFFENNMPIKIIDD